MPYLKAGKFLYRGFADRQSGHDNSSVIFGDSTKGKPRKSIGEMANYYTLWMTYNEKWKDKPRREHSFIVSSEPNDAGSWGKLYLVVPSNDVKIGEVGENDIWNKVLANDFNYANFTKDTFEILKVFKLEDSATTYEGLAKTLKSVTLEQMLDKRVSDDAARWYITDRMVNYMKSKKYQTLYDAWEKVFDPSEFNFMTSKNISGRGEFWIEGECMFITLLNHGMSEEDVDDMLGWADDMAPKLAKVLRSYWYKAAKDEIEDDLKISPDRVSARDTLTYTKKRKR